MSEHDYERKADEAERELADMEERSGKVGDQIEDARKDWEAKVADPAVPGAAGDPDRAEEGGRHPETAYPAKGGENQASSSDPAGGGVPADDDEDAAGPDEDEDEDAEPNEDEDAEPDDDEDAEPDDNDPSARG